MWRGKRKILGGSSQLKKYFDKNNTLPFHVDIVLNRKKRQTVILRLKKK